MKPYNTFRLGEKAYVIVNHQIRIKLRSNEVTIYFTKWKDTDI